MERATDPEETTREEKLLLLHQVKCRLRQVSMFLLPYLPLANAHNSDFIVCEHWLHHVHPSVADDLLKLSDDELCLLPSGSLFRDGPVGVTDDSCHVTCGQCNDWLAQGADDPNEEIQSLMVCNASSTGGPGHPWDRSIHARWSHASLRDFVQDASLNTLPRLGVLSDVGQLKSQLRRNTSDKIHISNFMSPKKSHEVDAMAEMCALLATNKGLSKVVDIGSGRGYLGCQMALMHGLRVLGIDSSETNTQSADKRAGKLGKQWQGLLRNANGGKLGKAPRLKKVKGSKERSTADLIRCNDDDMPDLSLVFNDGDSCSIELEASKDSVLMGDDKKGDSCSIELEASKDSVLMGDDKKGDSCGIELEASKDSVLMSDDKKGDSCSIELEASKDSVLMGDDKKGDSCGIELEASKDSVLMGDDKKGDSCSIELEASKDSVLMGDDKKGDSCGVELEASKDSVLMGDYKKGEITVADKFDANCRVSGTTNSLSCNGHCTMRTEVNKKQEFVSDENDEARCDMKIQSNEPLDDQKNHKCGQKSEVSKKNNAQKCTKTSYVAITCYVTPDLNLTELFGTFSPWSLSESDRTESDRTESDQTSSDHHKGVLMSGLHTCGNLAASMLQLFSTSGATVVMCNVGCCYHLLEEEFLRSPFSKQEEGDGNVQAGFPMSSYLRQRGCQLGRNARTLASQAPDRLANDMKLPDRSIYWRALLQEVLCDVTGVGRDDWQARNGWQVGKIALKCRTFTEYVRKALQKLQLDHHEMSDEAITEYERTHYDHERMMNAFFQLKLVLAPCIEALVLLDRLYYLLEQDNISSVHLLQMFDPVTSPRCYALIATK